MASKSVHMAPGRGLLPSVLLLSVRGGRTYHSDPLEGLSPPSRQQFGAYGRSPQGTCSRKHKVRPGPSSHLKHPPEGASRVRRPGFGACGYSAGPDQCLRVPGLWHTQSCQAVSQCWAATSGRGSMWRWQAEGPDAQRNMARAQRHMMSSGQSPSTRCLSRRSPGDPLWV